MKHFQLNSKFPKGPSHLPGHMDNLTIIRSDFKILKMWNLLLWLSKEEVSYLKMTGPYSLNHCQNHHQTMILLTVLFDVVFLNQGTQSLPFISKLFCFVPQTFLKESPISRYWSKLERRRIY